MLHRSLLWLTGLFLCACLNAQAKEMGPVFFPKKIPIECRDRETYELSDCDSAKRLQYSKDEQDNLPDKKRLNFTQLGDNLLLEKTSGLRAGLYKIQNSENNTLSTGFIIGTQKSALMYEIGSFEGCSKGSAIKILQNTPEFTFFYWECDDMRLGRRKTESFDYYNFDKKYQRLDKIASAPNVNKTLPTLMYNGDTYKFLWKNYTEKRFEPIVDPNFRTLN